MGWDKLTVSGNG